MEALYPALCPLCGAPSDRHCALGGCSLHRLPDPAARAPGPRCDRCARALPPMLPDGTRCAVCRRRAPRPVQVVSLDDYRSNAALREWILALKHRGRRDLAEPLGRALAARLLDVLGQAPRGALLIPVPLHPLRRMQRGYDQARELAQAAARALGARCLPCLVRRRWTPPQGAPESPGRRANVHSAFAMRRSQPLDLTGVAVWLVDDVLTSGATLDECAQVLASQGARRVGVLCLARAGEGTSLG